MPETERGGESGRSGDTERGIHGVAEDSGKTSDEEADREQREHINADRG